MSRQGSAGAREVEPWSDLTAKLQVPHSTREAAQAVPILPWHSGGKWLPTTVSVYQRTVKRS
jgi:hypothetical protein